MSTRYGWTPTTSMPPAALPTWRSEGPGALLAIIREMGGATRRDLLLATRLARATVESRLDKLIASGLVTSREIATAAGRPPQMFYFNESGGYLACIHMGSTQTQLGITDLGANLLAHSSVDLDLSMGPGVALGKVGSLLRQMLQRERIDPVLVLGVGVGVPGHVELTGRMVRLPFDGQSTTAWGDMIIDQEIRAFLPALGIGSVPVAVDKDANNMALGEWQQSWPEVRDMIVLKVGMSLSCGIVTNSEIVRGAHGLAGDVAHIPDPDSDVRCTCGQRGCAAAVASGRGIARMLETDSGTEQIRTGRDLVRLQRLGRRDVHELMTQAGERLGILMGAAIATLNPQLVVVGGNLAHDNPLLVDTIRSVALSRVPPLTAMGTRVLAGRISDQSGLYGAAHLALRSVLDPVAVDRAIDQGLQLNRRGISARGLSAVQQGRN